MNISESFKRRLQSLAGLNEVKNAHTNEYGALMLSIEYPDWNKITSVIDKDDLYDEEPGFGIEKNPHVTVLFGFHKDIDIDKLKELVKEKQKGEVEIDVKSITHFETPDYDVVKFDVDSKQLHALNKMATDNFEYTTDYPDYHPHMTIAYVKKGLGKKYDKKQEEIKMTGNHFVYSPPADGKKTNFKV